MQVLCIVLFGLACLIALGNISGAVGAWRRLRRGDRRGFSMVPLVSLLLAVGAWWAGPEPFGRWVFVPALVDPGTWTVPVAVVYGLLGRN